MPGTTFSTSNWTGYDEQSATNPGGALTDFTLLIDVSTFSATWKSNVQSDGADIRCAKGDDTELPYDLINWAYNAGAPTGWIRVKWSGTLAASGTQNVRVWVGYTGGTAVAYDANETYGSDNAYDSSWVAYYPLADLNDRTSNGYNLTATGSPAAGEQKVAGGYDLDGSTQYLTNTTFAALTYPITLMGWGKSDSLTADQTIVSVGDKDSTNNWAAISLRGTATGDPVRVHTFNTPTYKAKDTGAFSTSAFEHAAGVYEASDITAYSDGAGSALGSSNTLANCDSVRIGATARSTPSDFMNGDVDDVQVHSTARSADWIAEEYAQANSQATFWGTWAWTAGGGGGGGGGRLLDSLLLNGGRLAGRLVG